MLLAAWLLVCSGPAPPGRRGPLAARHLGQGHEGMTPAEPTGLDCCPHRPKLASTTSSTWSRWHPMTGHGTSRQQCQPRTAGMRPPGRVA
jgi:hypothetical protein